MATEKRTISSDGKRMFFKDPTIFFNQMMSFYPMKDEMLAHINEQLHDKSLKLTWNELSLMNEFQFFQAFNFIAQAVDYAYIANFGNYALRFNICIDKLLALLGHNYLVKSGLYDKLQSEHFNEHPLIVNYGPKHHSEYADESINIDRDASYSFYSYRTPKNPIVIDDFIDETDFKKEIIKRSLSGYFYNDMTSCGSYQAINKNPVGSIDATILTYLFNYISMLNIFTHLIDFL